jgi:membrane protease subunit HflK
VLTSSKAEIQIEAIESAQNRLDAFGAGIVLLGGNLQIVSPPAPVIAAFNDVVAAKKDSESLIENARLYANQTVPGARGEAETMVARARGNAGLRVNEAQGEASRFENLLAEYRRDPKVTRQRLYLETLERVLAKTDVVVVRDGSRITILDDQNGQNP